MKKVKASYTLGRLQNGAATLENSLIVPQMLKIEIPYDSVIPHLVIYQRAIRTYGHTNTCT